MTQRSNIAAWLRLIRWPNLGIIFLTQAAIWICLICPYSDLNSPRALNAVVFLLLTSSTILIAAAGYIINDYFDVQTDLINRPDKVILTQKVARRKAILLHVTCNLLGILCAYLAAWKVGASQLVFIPIGCSILLWFYSTHLKRMFLLGNILVSFMAGLTILLVWLFATDLHSYSYEPAILERFAGKRGFSEPNPFYMTWVYTLFAFFITWMREIVKDMEDLKGDIMDDCRTMPIRWGLLKTTYFVQVIGSLVCLMMIASIYLMATNYYIIVSILLTILVVRLAKLLVVLELHSNAAHYASISRRLKQIMIFGLIILAVLWACIDFKKGGSTIGYPLEYYR